MTDTTEVTPEHHPADPHAAERLTRRLEEARTSRLIVLEPQDVADLHEVLRQRADARDEGRLLAEGSATLRGRLDDALTERDGLRAKLAVVEKQRDGWRDAWIKLEAETGDGKQQGPQKCLRCRTADGAYPTVEHGLLCRECRDESYPSDGVPAGEVAR